MAELSALEAAVVELRKGNRVAAETLVADAARRAEADHGRDHPAFAAAQFDLAQILVGTGDLPRAVAALRTACSIRPAGDRESEKNRLTYLMNLGEVLSRLERYDEAEAVLKDGVAGRESFYGREHPGYAFGLEPLADVLLHKGDAEKAHALIEEALRVLWRDGHPRVAQVLALRAHIEKARSGLDQASFDQAAELPDPVFDEMVTESLYRAETGHPDLSLAVLKELAALIETRRGASDPALVHVLAAVTNVARVLGDHAARIDAFHRLVRMLDDREDALQAFDAVQGLALAQSEAHDQEGAERSYRDATERGRALGEPALLSSVLRNFGLYLSQLERHDAAEELLRGAVAEASTSGDDEAIGRARVALGIFAQHRGRLDEARIELDRAVELLDADHPDCLVARSHRAAIESNASCGCGDMTDAVSHALRELVLPHLPPGLLADLRARPGDDGQLHLDVQLAREPTEQETELLQRVIHQAMAALRERIDSRGFG